MNESIDQQIPAHAREKAAMQSQESSDLERRHSHREVADRGSNEADLHESEKDIPVRDNRAIIKYSSHTYVNIT